MSRYTAANTLFASLVLAVGLADRTAAQEPQIVTGPGISFSTLTGSNFSTYSGHSEGDFSVTPTAGSWLVATVFGNPTPSILDGPLNAPGIGVLQITDSAGHFTLHSFDYSSNNGDSSYDIQGFLGATRVFEETGTLPGDFGGPPQGFHFSTLLTANPSTAVDGLLITLIPGSFTTSINLDSIGVTTLPVPEPGGALLGMGFVALVMSRIQRQRFDRGK